MNGRNRNEKNGKRKPFLRKEERKKHKIKYIIRFIGIKD